MPTPKTITLAERYDRSLRYARGKQAPAEVQRPLPTSHWHQDNLALFERYAGWLHEGGTSEQVSQTYYLPMAGHVLGLTLKHHSQLDLEHDLECAVEYVKSKGVGASWLRISRLAVLKFRRFMRLERGLGEENQVTPFDSVKVTSGLPLWLVSELERYQHLQQRNWREARIEQSIRRFWSGYLRVWRFLVEQCGVQSLADLKRKHILDFLDRRLSDGYAVSGINSDLRMLITFLQFLQGEGYNVPQSLLRIKNLKQPDTLPKYLTDEQVQKLRGEIERAVREEVIHSRLRVAMLVSAAFHLLWQGGMRLGEVEELRLEDLDFAQKRLTVREGKGKKTARSI